mmetsp:Transcript_17688/g.23414  ORF Transcript_17688/g.23414 Transcript_17688/m.23414 type:complete len:191 (-) Transcript_17688:7-579(-)
MLTKRGTCEPVRGSCSRSSGCKCRTEAEDKVSTVSDGNALPPSPGPAGTIGDGIRTTTDRCEVCGNGGGGSKCCRRCCSLIQPKAPSADSVSLFFFDRVGEVEDDPPLLFIEYILEITKRAGKYNREHNQAKVMTLFAPLCMYNLRTSFVVGTVPYLMPGLRVLNLWQSSAREPAKDRIVSKNNSSDIIT